MTTTIDEWLDLMPAEVVVETYISSDSYAKPVFATPSNTYRARVVYKTRRMLSPSGEVIVSRGIVWLATVDPVSDKDRITLPDGTQPLILNVDQVPDENGPLYTRLDFS